MATMNEDVKKELFVDVANIIIDALNTGKLMNEDAHKASGFILDKLNPITNEDEFKIALEEFVGMWPIFQPVLGKLKNAQAQQEDQQKMSEIQDKLKSFITTPTN